MAWSSARLKYSGVGALQFALFFLASLKLIASDNVFLAVPVEEPANIAKLPDHVSQVHTFNLETEPDIIRLIALDSMLAVGVKADEFSTLFFKCSSCKKFMTKRSGEDHRSDCPGAS